MITKAMPDRIDRLTERALKHFNRMVEAQLVFGLTHYHYYNSKVAYERALYALGQVITDAVGLPYQLRQRSIKDLYRGRRA